MGTVYFARLVAPGGFSRTVALKRLHPAFAKDPEFAAMLLDEARLASRVKHPNVVQVLDVVAAEGELLLVLDYVPGVPLARLIQLARRTGAPPPAAMASAIMSDVLAGLHAAHEARSEVGEPLELVHRDVSPQNILVHENGVALVTDFGIARAVGRSQTTREGQTKGKPGYMAPEQIRGERVTRRTDIFAAGVLLWEVFTGHRLFGAGNDLAIARKVLMGRVDPPSRVWPEVPPAIDDIALRALEQSPEARFESAAEMQQALEQAVLPASRSAVAAWVRSLAGDFLAERAEEVLRIEREPVSEPAREPAATAPMESFAAATAPDMPAHTAPGVTPSPRPQDEGNDPTGVTAAPRSARSPSRAILIAVALAGGLSGAIIAGRVLLGRSSTPEAAPQAAAPQTAAPRAAGAEGAASAEPSPGAGAATGAPVAMPPEPASTPPVSAATPPVKPSAGARAPVTPPRPAPAAPAGCNPPTYINERGITVFKTQCLTKR